MRQAPAPETLATPGSTGIDPVGVFRTLAAAGASLFSQATLHGELARIEWAQERRRLLTMLVITLLGFACLLCVMLAASALLLALCWDTAYRIPAAVGLIALHGLGTVIAWRRFQALAALGGQGFAATRAELAADVALLRNSR